METNLPQLFIMMGTQGDASNRSETEQNNDENKNKEQQKLKGQEKQLQDSGHPHRHRHGHSRRHKKGEETSLMSEIDPLMERDNGMLGIDPPMEGENGTNSTMRPEKAPALLVQDKKNDTKDNSTPKKLNTETGREAVSPNQTDLSGNSESVSHSGQSEEWVKTKYTPQAQKVSCICINTSI